MSNHVTHTYHLVDESPWPLWRAMGALFLTTGLLDFFWAQNFALFGYARGLIISVALQWWRDVAAEARFQGLHRRSVELGIRWGIALFIVSGVFFFLRFFWAFFHRSLSISTALGCVWPPLGVCAFNPWQVPLLNTLILLSSGVRVTWAHHAITSGADHDAVAGLVITLLLGGYFTFLQGLEYYEAKFTFRDGVFGSTFFIATGFHGIHVIIGTLFLLVNLGRLLLGEFSATHHFGFEAAAWYWHFVDVVWLFLFLTIYIWGGSAM